MKLSQEQLDALRDQLRLSPRETQVLDLLFQGVPTNADMAECLGTTEGAVKGAVRTLYLKARTRSKHETVLCCLDLLEGRLGILDPNSPLVTGRRPSSRE